MRNLRNGRHGQCLRGQFNLKWPRNRLTKAGFPILSKRGIHGRFAQASRNRAYQTGVCLEQQARLKAFSRSAMPRSLLAHTGSDTANGFTQLVIYKWPGKLGRCAFPRACGQSIDSIRTFEHVDRDGGRGREEEKQDYKTTAADAFVIPPHPHPLLLPTDKTLSLTNSSLFITPLSSLPPPRLLMPIMHALRPLVTRQTR